MKNVLIHNCEGRGKTVHGPMTEQEAIQHTKKLHKIIDHEVCWVEIVDSNAAQN